MRRFWAIIMVVILYLAWGTTDFALINQASDSSSVNYSCLVSSSQLAENHLSDNQANDLSDIAELMRHSFRSYCVEFQTSATSHYTSLHELQNNTTLRNTLRHRSLSERIMAEAIHSRRAGHITKIFEFNIFTSSLRVAYYLHTLCRLRI